ARRPWHDPLRARRRHRRGAPSARQRPCRRPVAPARDRRQGRGRGAQRGGREV
ncbi:MAG: hypothetical protein AVDCRST_MAG32-588, partial [uncultured Nocardioides sp.]